MVSLSSLSALYRQSPLPEFFNAVSAPSIQAQSAKVTATAPHSLLEFARTNPHFAHAVTGQSKPLHSQKLPKLLLEQQALPWRQWQSTWHEIKAATKLKRGLIGAAILTGQSTVIGGAYMLGSLAPVLFPTGLLSGLVAWNVSNRIMQAALSNPRIQKAMIPGLNEEDRTLVRQFVLGEGCGAAVNSGMSKCLGLFGIGFGLSISANTYLYAQANIGYHPELLLPGALVALGSAVTLMGLNTFYGSNTETLHNILSEHREHNKGIKEQNAQLVSEIKKIRRVLTLNGATDVLANYPGIRGLYLKEKIIPQIHTRLKSLNEARSLLEQVIIDTDGSAAKELRLIDQTEKDIKAYETEVLAQIELLGKVRVTATLDQVPESVRRGLGILNPHDQSQIDSAIAKARQPFR